MKHLLCLMILALLALPAAGQERADKSAANALVEREVRLLDSRLLEAIWKADPQTRNQLAADDLVYISYSGEALNKARWISSVEKAADPAATYQVVQETVRLNDRTAVITGRVEVQFREVYENGSSREGKGQYRYTHVYVQQDRSWRLSAGQVTPVAKYLWKGGAAASRQASP